MQPLPPSDAHAARALHEINEGLPDRSPKEAAWRVAGFESLAQVADAPLTDPRRPRLVDACRVLREEEAAAWYAGAPSWPPRTAPHETVAVFVDLVRRGDGWPLARRIWDRNTVPLARAWLYCEGDMLEDGPWWSDGAVATEILEALRTLDERSHTAPIPRSAEGFRGRLPLRLDWQRGARRWPAATWFGLLKLATQGLGAMAGAVMPLLEDYTASGAPPMPDDLLEELLQHRSARVRLWAQCELGRPAGTGAPEPSRPRSWLP